MKIKLVDNAISGHHKIYQNSLNNIDKCYIDNQIIEFYSMKKNPIKAYFQRKRFIEKSVEKESDIIHFLYIDSIYKCFMIHKNIKHKNVIGTLHWVPKNKINQILLRKFCSKLKYVIVHSEYLKDKMIDIGIENSIVIEYPSFIKRSKIKSNNDKIIISCLGGTRKDKGLDILMNSFKYIEDKAKKECLLNLVGKEQDIKYSIVENTAKKYNINLNIKNKFLTDKEYNEEILKSDVILLPYRKIFNGNSGPMTDGIYANKFIIGPNYGNLGFLINKYNLGDTFKVEDSIDLAKKISNLCSTSLIKEHEYSKKLSIDNFLESHKKLYLDIINKRN